MRMVQTTDTKIYVGVILFIAGLMCFGTVILKPKIIYAVLSQLISVSEVSPLLLIIGFVLTLFGASLMFTTIRTVVER
jgi:hypothetical protein